MGMKVKALDCCEPTLGHPVSQLCTESQLLSRAFPFWCCQMKERAWCHRKQWELCYILALGVPRGVTAPDSQAANTAASRASAGANGR